MIPKLSTALYAAITLFHTSNTDTIKSIYFTYFHSTVKHGIILGDNSSKIKENLLYKRKLLEP
jgi:hypothetical protein